ncbi:hypothetical protein Tco_0531747 [Tanacetum coccineum]
MAHASRVSDSVNLPSELPTNEARPEGSNASPNSHIGKCSTVQHHMNLVQAPTHEEIAKIVQNIVNAHMPEPIKLLLLIYFDCTSNSILEIRKCGKIVR